VYVINALGAQQEAQVLLAGMINSTPIDRLVSREFARIRHATWPFHHTGGRPRATERDP